MCLSCIEKFRPVKSLAQEFILSCVCVTLSLSLSPRATLCVCVCVCVTRLFITLENILLHPRLLESKTVIKNAYVLCSIRIKILDFRIVAFIYNLFHFLQALVVFSYLTLQTYLPASNHGGVDYTGFCNLCY